MKQLDFFKLFSSKIQDATPPPDFSGADWAALSSRLDAHDRKRSRVLPLGWLAGLTGLLLLSNLGWFLAWKKTDDRIAASQAGQPKPVQPMVQRDTVFQKIVVYQYDTVYQTVVVKRQETGSWAKTQLPSTNFYSNINSPKTAQEGNRTSPEAASSNPASPSGSMGEEMLGVYEAKNLLGGGTGIRQPSPEALAPVEIRPFRWGGKHPMLPGLDDFPMKAVPQNTAFPLVPRWFALYGMAGSLKPSTEAIANSSGFSAGLLAEIGFSDQLSLTVDGAYGRTGFRGYVDDETLGLPVPSPPSDEYDLKYFETHDDRKPLFQLGLGMRWYFTSKTKLNPLLGASWTTQWNPGYELELEYVNRFTGMERSEEVHVAAPSKPLYYAGFSLGLRYQLGQKWQVLAIGTMDFKLSQQAGISRWNALRLGIGYQF
jgi:hypothetical protein